MMWGSSHKLRNEEPPQKLKGRETESPLEPLEVVQSYQSLDVSLLKPILDFWISEL